MSHDASNRPTLSKIIYHLKTMSNLLIPCLDVPSTSIMIGSTDSLEMALQSCQSTVTHPNAFTHQRRKSSSQEIIGLLRKVSSSQGLKFMMQRSSQKLDVLTVVRQQGDGAGIENNSEDSKEDDPLFVSSRPLSSSERNLQLVDSKVDRSSSDYFSDNSKETFQAVSSV